MLKLEATATFKIKSGSSPNLGLGLTSLISMKNRINIVGSVFHGCIHPPNSVLYYINNLPLSNISVAITNIF